MTILLFLLTAFSIQAQQTVLYPGLSSTIPSAPGPVVVDKKGIVTVTDMGHRLKIVAKKTGRTQITSGGRAHEVFVLRQNTYETYRKLLKWLEDKQGPTVVVEDLKVYVRGEFLTYVDWMELHRFMSEGDDFTIQAKIDSSGKERINKYLSDLSEKNNLPFSDMNTLPNWEISIASAHKNNLPVYKKIFSPYGIKINHSSYALSAIPMIEVTILATEIKRTDLLNLGVEWPGATQFQVLPQLGHGGQSVTVNLHHLEEKGSVKVLASPTLLTQSGEEATFHSGGEFPIKTSNQFNANVQWKKYGIILKMKPLADFTGKMDIQIDCEVSSLDHSQVDGVPGLLTNRISSHFNLKESRTIALSGLLREETGKQRKGLPGLSQIPFFSQLFSSDMYRNNQSELVFFVTPRIVR